MEMIFGVVVVAVDDSVPKVWRQAQGIRHMSFVREELAAR